MIKAEVIREEHVTELVSAKVVNIEAKGTHHDIVMELKSVIETFNEKESYRLDLMNIIKGVLEVNLDKEIKELEKLKKENK